MAERALLIDTRQDGGNIDGEIPQITSPSDNSIFHGNIKDVLVVVRPYGIERINTVYPECYVRKTNCLELKQCSDESFITVLFDREENWIVKKIAIRMNRDNMYCVNYLRNYLIHIKNITKERSRI